MPDSAQASSLILEDESTTRNWLAATVRTAFPATTCVAVGTIAAARHWLAGAPRDGAPICLIDIGLPDGSGIDFVRDLLAIVPRARAVIVTLYEDDGNLLAAMAAGAHGYILKDREQDVLVDRLRRLDAGEVPMSPAMADRVLDLFRKHARFMTGQSRETSALTPREAEVLRLIGRGLTIAEAGHALGIAASTASGYVKSIYRKLEITSRAEAAIEAARRGYV